jgi:hypothetical protein
LLLLRRKMAVAARERTVRREHHGGEERCGLYHERTGRVQGRCGRTRVVRHR